MFLDYYEEIIQNCSYDSKVETFSQKTAYSGQLVGLKTRLGTEEGRSRGVGVWWESRYSGKNYYAPKVVFMKSTAIKKWK